MTPALATPDPAALRALNDSFESQQPQDVLAYVISAYFPDLVLASSFGAEDVALIDMAHRINSKTPIFYLDTDFLFTETYETRDRLIAKYDIAPIQVTSLLTPERQAETFGDKLWERRPDECCNQRKVEPLTRILKNYKAWITGIRRDQAPTRANAGLIEWDQTFQLVKCNPLARWTSEAVWAYITQHNVPYNSLHDQHYPSIGCTYCTKPVMPGEDPRSGRWAGQAKTECGLHGKS